MVPLMTYDSVVTVWCPESHQTARIYIVHPVIRNVYVCESLNAATEDDERDDGNRAYVMTKTAVLIVTIMVIHR